LRFILPIDELFFNAENVSFDFLLDDDIEEFSMIAFGEIFEVFFGLQGSFHSSGLVHLDINY